MTEWWVSQKKHFCEYCKVWTGGHLWQIRKHEEGRMHTEKKETYLRNCRQREKDRQREEQDLKKQIAAIEKAAQDAMDRAPYSDGFANLVELPEASAPPPPPPAPSGGSGGGSGGGRGGGMGMMPVPEAMEAAPTVDVQKAVIQHMVEAAKRKRVEAEGPSKPAPKAPTPVAEGSPWLVCTDPKSGAMYYYNKDTKVSAWERPAPAAPDPSKAPPPQAKAPPPPARPGCVGQWQEVLPEESMWANHAEMEAAREREQRQAAPELFEDEITVNPLADMKYEVEGWKGHVADEDLEKHEKQIEQKRSLTAGSASFPVNKKRASGIRKKREED